MSQRINYKLLLAGVDITSHALLKVGAEERPITIVSALNSELDTLDLMLKDGDALAVAGWQDIRVEDQDNAAVPLFGGYVQLPSKNAGFNRAVNDYRIGASDYGAYLDTVFVQMQFTNQTDAQIIAAVVAACPELSGFNGASFVKGIRTFPKVTFNLKSVKEIINWLATQAGANWYVDYAKMIHYFASDDLSAPFGITDDLADATNCPAEDVSINQNASGVANIIELVGGMALKGDATYQFTESIYATDLWMNKKLKPWDGASEIVVRRNDGGPTTNLVVNPSFETNITDGWTQYQAGSGATWAQDATKYASGSKSLKIVAGTKVAVLQGATLSLAPGETLTAQAKVYAPLVGIAAVVIWDITNSVNRGECYNRKTNSWELVTAGYYNNTGTTLSVRVELYNNACDSASACYYDSVQAEKKQWPTAYCDGSLGTGYAWSGTANNSASTRVDMPIWTTLTVKVGNSDTLAGRNEVLYFESQGLLQQETFWPTIVNAIEVDGQEETPVHVVTRNYASYVHFGKWFKKVITDSSIVDAGVARMRCAAELAQNAYETTAISLKVRRTGLRSGQTITVDLPARGISGNYLIQRATTKIYAGGYVEVDLELGVLDKNLVSILMDLAKATQVTDADILSDQVINQVLDFHDSAGISDGAVTVATSRKPYKYGTAKWGYSKWG